MTRKDYVEVAGILNKFLDRIDSHAFNDLVFEFSDMFLADNKNFDEVKFEIACYEEGRINVNDSIR